MHYSVTLERGSDGGYMAWVHELPGCFARGATREEVEAKLKPAIEEFCAWLRRAGEAILCEPVEFSVVEEVESPCQSAEADSDVLLAPDRDPLTPEAWRPIERWLRLSRRDLLGVLRRVGDERLEWKPEGTPRNTREHLTHVAFVEFMYCAWTFDLHSRDGIADFLRWTRKIALSRMRELGKKDQGAITRADWGGAPRPEPWTARKAARRLVWHERLHLRALQRLNPLPLRGEE